MQSQLKTQNCDCMLWTHVAAQFWKPLQNERGNLAGSIPRLKRLLLGNFALNQRSMSRHIRNAAVMLVGPSWWQATARDALVDEFRSRNTKMGEKVIRLILSRYNCKRGLLPHQMHNKYTCAYLSWWQMQTRSKWHWWILKELLTGFASASSVVRSFQGSSAIFR